MDEINWEDYNPKEIKLPETSIPKDLFRELVEFLQNAMEKENELMSLTTDVLDRLYREIGDEEETATMVISYLQRRHKWDVELLAERRDVDDILFRDHNLFDEHMWDKVMNAQAISDLHHEVYKLSQTYIARAIREVLRKDGAEEKPPF
jgi:type I site-specific restriction endonuclease